jgi:hypothetical protein
LIVKRFNASSLTTGRFLFLDAFFTSMEKPDPQRPRPGPDFPGTRADLVDALSCLVLARLRLNDAQLSPAEDNSPEQTIPVLSDADKQQP